MDRKCNVWLVNSLELAISGLEMKWFMEICLENRIKHVVFQLRKMLERFKQNKIEEIMQICLKIKKRQKHTGI